MDKLKTCIVGATGVVGQQFIMALQEHPWFEISSLAASERSAGKTYLEALKDERTKALRWFCDEQPNEKVLGIKVNNAETVDVTGFDVVFSAVEADVAKQLEPKFAEKTAVISTASTFRYEEDVPILVPGVNSEQAKIIKNQRKKRGWKGFITTQPNCTTTGMVITLKPILDSFGVNKVIMTSLQAMSGAGRSPGVIGLDILDNVIPYISGEEEKVQTETLKILGRYTGEKIVPIDIKVSCTCTRVNVLEGHTEAVFLSTDRECSVDEIKEAFKNFGEDLNKLKLPSAPKEMIVVNDDPFRPQPRLDRGNYDGMATTVGRIRKDYALENGIKYVLVSHNTKMGAAKGAVLVAEHLKKEGYI
ncbi:MAG: aspartate-semialdehyde dehydrogenase [Candidatus Bathyarchaeota archaeon]